MHFRPRYKLWYFPETNCVSSVFEGDSIGIIKKYLDKYQHTFASGSYFLEDREREDIKEVMTVFERGSNYTIMAL